MSLEEALLYVSDNITKLPAIEAYNSRGSVAPRGSVCEPFAPSQWMLSLSGRCNPGLTRGNFIASDFCLRNVIGLQMNSWVMGECLTKYGDLSI